MEARAANLQMAYTQSGVRQIVENILSRKKENTCIRYDRLAYSRARGQYVLFLSSQEYVGVAQMLELRRTVAAQLPEMQDFRVVVRQPAALLEDALLLERTVREFLVAEEPGLIPFLCPCKVARQGDFLEIIFGRELAPELFSRMQASQKVERFLEESYGLELKIRKLTCDLNTEQTQKESQSAAQIYTRFVKKSALPKRPEQRRSAQREQGAQARAAGAAPEASQGGRKQAPPRARRARSMEGELTKIADLLPESEAIIEGDILFVETRLIRDGKDTLLTFGITDYTSSIKCKKFLKGTVDELLEQIKKGKRFKVRGRNTYDAYAREYTFHVLGVQETHKTELMDEAEHKRVELHLHTTMSAQDGVSSAEAYIARAAKWGHRAVAITDHGVVQAFPEAANAAKKYGIKVIFGMEAYLVDDQKKIYKGAEDRSFLDEFIVFDIETTGFRPDSCEIIEIGAVRVKNGEILDTFGMFARPKKGIPYEITKLTGITEAMVEDAPEIEEVIEKFWAFAGDACLVAHNADFDTAFVFKKSQAMGIEVKSDVLDTLAVARAHLKQLKSFKLNKLGDYYGVSFGHHRAVNDAEATAKIMLHMFAELKQKGVQTLQGLNTLADAKSIAKSARPFHAIILCKNKTGLVNLYKLVSLGHLEYFHTRPRIPKSVMAQHREGLIFGSACEQGEIYRAILEGADDAQLEELAAFYDYLEIQPHGNNAFLIREGRVADEEELSEINRRICRIASKRGMPVCATTDAHFLNEEDAYFRQILMETTGFKDADQQAPLFFKTTAQMLEDFSYLGEQKAMEVVVENPNAIADQVEQIELFPKETAMPYIENADKEILERAYAKAKRLYGDPLPQIIQQRLDKEMGSIIRNGFAVLYWSAMKLVDKSMQDGYLVGSRGSVGSSFAAFADDITEVNPLPPHYRCPKCQHYDFNVDREKYGCGVDMPEAYCPVCGEKYIADGFDIPFEVFLGLNAEKVPDIDLNFSGEYRPRANKYVEELFGEEYVFRAGTISAIQENTAKGIVRKFAEMHNMQLNSAELERLAMGISGVKKTTGQHPGGLVIVPHGREIYEFSPIQKPADKMAADTVTTHFDFNSMHDILIKLDILGHDNPTMIRMLQDLIGFDPLKIPLNDPKTMSLFMSTQALGITPEQIRGVTLGTFGIPEFGTPATMSILKKTKPKTLSELIRISGISHGTDVWKGNAEDLIDSGTAPLSGVICTRDDIMNHLVHKGVEHKMAFFIMESVRKGKWAKGKEKDQQKMEQAMRDAGVEEWFIESCRKIQYMFPKAHAVAYVVMALRIAYCKVHYPAEFYATTFTIKLEDFDAPTILQGVPAIKARLKELDELGMKKSATEKGAGVVLELALEMLERGLKFLPVDLKKSKAKQFSIEEGKIRMPFMAVPQLGDKAAELLEQAAAEGDFLSVEELKKKCRLSASVLDTMREMGCLAGLPEKSQLTIFDVLG